MKLKHFQYVIEADDGKKCAASANQKKKIEMVGGDGNRLTSETIENRQKEIQQHNMLNDRMEFALILISIAFGAYSLILQMRAWFW